MADLEILMHSESNAVERPVVDEDLVLRPGDCSEAEHFSIDVHYLTVHDQFRLKHEYSERE